MRNFPAIPYLLDRLVFGVAILWNLAALLWLLVAGSPPLSGTDVVFRLLVLVLLILAFFGNWWGIVLTALTEGVNAGLLAFVLLSNVAKQGRVLEGKSVFSPAAFLSIALLVYALLRLLKILGPKKSSA